jgi:hypothetical protein
VNYYRLVYDDNTGEVAAFRFYGTGFVGENHSRGTYGSPRITPSCTDEAGSSTTGAWSG